MASVWRLARAVPNLEQLGDELGGTRRAYRKLDIHSREELAGAFSERAPPTT
jgi:hypothetical protein